MQWAKKQTGFTIVELLIVVVVIAILAAITIVAYNGISQRAKTTATNNFAAQLKHRNLSDASGYWSFDECTGSSVNNTAGSAVSPTSAITGTLSWSVDTPSGDGCSLSFNGSTYVNTGVSLSNDYYLKSAWVKTTTTQSANIISDANPAGNSAFYITSGRLSTGHNGAWNAVPSQPGLNDGKWHFVTAEFIRNGSTSTGKLSISVDGAVVASDSTISTMGNPSLVTQLIGAYNNTSYFNGLIDDVMIVAK